MNELPIVLCTDVECRFVAEDRFRLAAVARVVVAENYEVPTLERRVANADLLVTSCFAQVPASVIDVGTRLRGIVKYGVGVDNIDLPAATRHGLPVANCPDYGSGTVADLAFAMLIALARRLTTLDRTFRRSGWFWPARFS